MAELTRTRERYEISTDPARVDLDAVRAYLTRSYWAEGISKAIVAKAIAGSLASLSSMAPLRLALRESLRTERRSPTAAMFTCWNNTGARAWVSGSWRSSCHIRSWRACDASCL
jgi:hypothetical protein